MALKYRIGEIGWHNFERLVQALLKKVMGPGVTSFGGSKDGGRDAALSGTAPYPTEQTRWSGSWVFQVKYVDLEDQGGASRARSAIKRAFKAELKSIQNKCRDIDNYVLITDVPLTAECRDALESIARSVDFRGNFAAIDGREVCEWLDIYPELRRSFPQLLGLVDLNVIVNADVYNRSKAYFEQWSPRLAVFVQTEAYTKSLYVLREHRFLVLDGPPEVGKSMMAAAVALLYASEGFQVYDVRSPDQLFAVLQESGPQLFIADDAIGSIDLDAGKADSWARDLPGVVRCLDKNHLLIWTARHYILEEALSTSRLSESLDNFPGEHEVIVEVGDLREIEKAEMLYNHAKQANLSPVIRTAIKQMARTLVHHPNLTPEKVRQIVEYLRSNQSASADKARKEISNFLDNPGSRWAKALRSLSESERTLLVSLVDLDEASTTDELKRAYETRSEHIPGPKLCFDDAVLRLKHSFITITRNYQGVETIDFKHPSLRDLIVGELRTDPVARRRYIQLTAPAGLAKLIRGVALSQDA